MGCRTSHQMIICTCHFYQMLISVSFILRASRYTGYFAQHIWHPYFVDNQNVFALYILVSKSCWFLNTTIMTNVNFSTIGINAPLPRTATIEPPLSNQTMLSSSFWTPGESFLCETAPVTFLPPSNTHLFIKGLCQHTRSHKGSGLQNNAFITWRPVCDCFEHFQNLTLRRPWPQWRCLNMLCFWKTS